jgi:hypothetical protein
MSAQIIVVGDSVFTALCLTIGLPILILVNSILRAFLESAWTLTFSQLVDTKG